MKKILIAILNYNGLEHLQTFFPSVVEHSSGAGILVIDNASTDGSIPWLRENYPHVRTVQMDKNYGFAGAYTRVLLKEDADYFVVLNNDVEVTSGWLGRMLEYMEEDPMLAAVQPKLLQYHQRTFFEYSGAAGGHLDIVGYPFCRGRVFDTLEEDKHQYNKSSDIFWACGAAMMIRASVFKETGGFDEDFFVHQEEIDLCWRIRQRGYSIRNVPEVTVYHLGGGTLTSGSRKKHFYNLRNSLFSITKNYPGKRVVMIILLRLALDGIYGLLMFFSGKFYFPFIIFHSHLSYYASLSLLISKRKKIQQMAVKKVYPDYRGSVVWNYFVRKKRYFTEIVRQPD